MKLPLLDVRTRQAKADILMSADTSQGGFTLVEVLASSVILLIASVGAIVAFNLITQSVRGTGLRADQSRRIDAQIAEINRLSEVYTACQVATGEVPSDLSTPVTACGTGADTAGIQVTPPNSFYFFPLNDANVPAFDAACNSGAQASHITAAFRTAINAIPPAAGTAEGGITRSAATRVAAGDSRNHLLAVEWSDAANRTVRTLRIAPLVSAWCP